MIQCPLCRKDNPEAYRFCVRCAKDLQSVGGGSGTPPTPDEARECPDCGAVGDGGHRFCWGCGIPLTGATSGGRTETSLRRSPDPGTVEIRHIQPDGTTRTYAVEGEVVVGRTDGEMRFPDDRRMSRRHAMLEIAPDGVTLRDLDSTNGTFIRVRENLELRPGDVILLGDQLFEYRT